MRETFVYINVPKVLKENMTCLMQKQLAICFLIKEWHINANILYILSQLDLAWVVKEMKCHRHLWGSNPACDMFHSL